MIDLHHGLQKCLNMLTKHILVYFDTNISLFFRIIDMIRGTFYYLKHFMHALASSQSLASLDNLTPNLLEDSK